MNLYEEDGSRKIPLKDARSRRSTTQCYIQKETGVPQSRISKIELGYVEPTEEEKAQIAKVLGVDQRFITWPALGKN